MEDLNFYKGKKVFITGHTGFKGSWLSRILINAGAIVTGYSLEPDSKPNLFKIAEIEKNIKHIVGDIRDLKSMQNAFDEAEPEIVFHLAAQPLVIESYKSPYGLMYICNVLSRTHSIGSIHLLLMCQNRNAHL